MAGDIPQFHRGKFGKITSQSMNAMGDSSRHSRNDLETSPTPFAREGVAGPGAWPMIAVITGPVTKGKQVIGFKWKEAKHSTDFVEDPAGRAYQEEDENYCIPLGVKESEFSEIEITGAVVKIDYISSANGTVLFFEMPNAVTSITSILRITEVHTSDSPPLVSPLTPYCAGFGANRRYKCEIVKADPDFFQGTEFDTQAPSFAQDPGAIGIDEVYAYNLLEYGAGYLGGDQEVNECEIADQLAVLPPGTRVLGKMIAQFTEDEAGESGEATNSKVIRAYAFSVANDSCVRCCLESEGMQSTFERGTQAAERKYSTISATSIRDEMLR